MRLQSSALRKHVKVITKSNHIFLKKKIIIHRIKTLGETKQIKGRAFDVWSMGVTLFALVHGHCPFQDASIIELYRKIIHEEANISEHLSDDLADLLQKMLKKNPEDRITLKEIREHPWTTENGINPMISEDENCIFEDITDEDVERAINVGIFTKVRFFTLPITTAC
jgi:serine/threonine protein kinase